jgi:hypothetical protein
VIGRCLRCGCEWQYETESIWQGEHEDPCVNVTDGAVCGGRIERVPPTATPEDLKRA